LYALCRESREKRDMGFEMSEWDERLLRYGTLFEDRIMNLEVNIPLFEALDRCWNILAECFEPQETGIRHAIIEAHWPKELAAQ
ncbi:MAG: V-type ATP synthase subunit B, partial [Planctomycetota bacterium]